MILSLLTFIAIMLHLAGIVVAMHAVMHTRTPQGAFAWTLGLVLLPYITLFLYLFLGRSHFYGYIDRHRLYRLRLSEPHSLYNWPQRHDYLRRHPADPSGRRYAAIGKMLGLQFHGGHRLRLLIDGEAAFTAIFEAIASAEHYVLVQFFIFHDDGLGRRMQQALLARAAAGVTVCVLYDGIGSHDLPASYVQTLRQGGVHIHAFATRRFNNRFQLNFRNHRKIVVVDGWRGFVGGLNVGDEYLGAKPPLSPWRDTQMELQGPAVADLQRSFGEDWYFVTNELPPFLPPRESDGSASTLIAATGPADPRESCSLLFVAAIHAARRRLWISTPYFVPDPAVSAALQLAVLRGVDVRVLIPARPDHYTVFTASTLYAYEAVRAGLQMYRYQPGFVHQKVMLIDDDTSMIGSMNLDNRSLRLNFEVSALNIDVEFARQVEQMLLTDFANAVELAAGDYRAASYGQRLAMHVARLFDPVL
ncbi:MAG: cardiolipin synthase [Dyella sp.]